MEKPVSITHLVIAIATAVLSAGMAYLVIRRVLDRLRAELPHACWRLAHDQLTGLHNRMGLQTLTAGGERNDQPIAVMLIDLDGFKEVNDTYGHGAGDELLLTIAARIAELAEAHGGDAARLSDDEFTVTIPGGDRHLPQLADLVNAVIAEPLEISTDDGAVTIAVTASLGVAVLHRDEELDSVALRHADAAMYHAKHQGGNCHVLYRAGMTMPAHEPRRGPRPRDLHRRAEDGGK